MAGLLNHRVIALTGYLASGKTTLSKHLETLLGQLEIPLVRVDKLLDLYAPAAGRLGLDFPLGGTRSEVTAAVHQVHERLGPDAGAQLVIDFLRPQSSSSVFLIDGMRSPAGATFLRQRISKLALIGVHAPIGLRRMRLVERKKPMDLIQANRVDPDTLIAQERIDYDIAALMEQADAIIENDCAVPFRTEMLLMDVLQRKGIVEAPSRLPFPVGPPYRKVSSPPDLPSLTMDMYIRGLDNFADKAAADNIVVVQANNRFASQYLRHLGLSVTDIKISSLTKQLPGVLVASMLTPLERIRRVDTGGVVVADLLQTLAAPELVPFSITTDDSLVSEEFEHAMRLISSPGPLGPEEERLLPHLQQSAVYDALTAGNRRIAFLDDILYRGRTIYSEWHILELFGLLGQDWRHHVICADRASQHLRHPKLDVFCPGYGYPFENSAWSERGYYDLVLSRFEFRDMSMLEPVLEQLWPIVREPWSSRSSWWTSLSRTATRLGIEDPALMRIARAVVAVVVHCHAFDLAPDRIALSDQRASQLGWCPDFLTFWDSFISQEQPVHRREQFKRDVQELIGHASDVIPLDLVDFYREHYANVWYNTLKRGRTETETQ